MVVYALGLCGSALAFENIVFPAVVQAHHDSGNASCNSSRSKLTMYNTSKITGTNGDALKFCSINSHYEREYATCDNSIGGYELCSITNSDIQGINLNKSKNKFKATNSSVRRECNASTLDVTGNEFGGIKLNSSCSLTLASQSEYLITSLELNNRSILYLPKGDYWLESLAINSTAQIIPLGDVRIFIKSSVNISNNVVINPNNNFETQIVSYDSLTLNGDVVINANIYVNNDITLNNQAIINGRVMSRTLTMTGSSQINDAMAKPNLQCFNDTFSQSALSSDWVVSRSSGTFTPSIVGGRMRLTQASQKQATASTYQRLFPAADNLVEIQFDHYAYGGATNNGADGIAMVLSDAAITPQPGAFGGPLGYGFKPGINGFAGGWLGVGIDEFGNFSGEGGSYNKSQRRQSVAVRGSGAGTSGYNYLHGTCNDGKTNTSGSCLSPTVDKNNVTPAHRYKITIDSQSAGQSMVKIERNTGSGFVTLIPAFNVIAESGQVAIPSDFLLSLTGSTGDYYNNHEIDNVQICALKSNPIGTQIDHFEFDHTGQGLTCNPETVTIRACANTSCSQLFTEPLTATLLPESTAEGVWVGGNQVSFSGGTAQLQLRRNTAGVVTLGVKGSSPTTRPLSKTLCRIGAGALSENNCSLTFADSGFIFDVPDKLANKPVEVLVKAVKKSDVTQQCIPSFQNQAKSLSFWSQYVEPSAPITPKPVTINSTAISAASAVPTALSLGFDINGQAKITVNYPDAGKLQLNAKYTGTGDEQGLLMIGSDQFVNVPVGLCVTPEDNGALCPAGNESCSVYKKAGESFNLQIVAKAWVVDNDGNYCDNPSTPNYVQSGIALSSQLVAPSSGVQGAVGVASYDQEGKINNLNTVAQSISEVGVFTFSAAPPSSYLGSSFYSIPLAKSANIGRFVPDHFEVTTSSVVPACSSTYSFSYMDQPFDVAFNLEARNVAGVVTQNYHGSFAKATGLLVGENNDDGNDMQLRLDDVAVPLKSSSWTAGEASIDYQPHFSRLPALIGGEVDGPYEQMLLGVKVFDNDGNVSSVASPNMNAATLGDCSAGTSCDAVILSAIQQRYRHGRVVMDNTYGPETETLSMPVRAEYWNGTNWVLNGDDSCTIATYGLGSQVDNAGLGYHFDPNLATGQSVVRSGGTSTFQSGQFELLWRAVATSGPLYRGQVTAPLDVPAWLEWYWNWNGVSPTSLSEPRASAFFGRYRGHDRIIYWREVN
ncbi:MSHA biogenesis protein MshQ [Shewanella sp. JNE10-2]|uniref:DUF6701 domain-containing protein n=1 Tax=unclassified Shewanella TaxID=196818 RepID=UPI002002F943|nr:MULTISPECIES: DUF6701 domain-containing protein [unclassified Shewanella]MCK7631950.1 MSHA biogenesis protein MshQ [Shewanella sp. JNE9-1]MCK7647136.1 MSHA biogenesis protein MshQ [Shewanella sp. JNE3-1]MCK7653650.1 MSHA biogenesis protein MshQ [Shewanella sp. JNE4-1]UPO29165.1 MSHA biogenesis protein MshQ [Shewanella sp. JNE10-2]UPO37317.1 MSHA biogenesis protein MshQ [Shewanella sp. JNE7]